MEQHYQVVFSKRAVEKLDTIVAYLNDNWSQQVKTDFLTVMADKIERLGRMPYLYKASSILPGCRECIVNYATILYYKVNEESKSVEIITIQSTRMDEVN